MSFSVLRNCGSCGSKNRVPPKRLADIGRCGACKSPLPPVAEPIDANAAALQAITAESRVPVLVDFWAPWCGPCRMAAPEVAGLAREMAGSAVVLKVNTEEHPDVAQAFGVQSIPLFVLFRDGRIAMRQPGLVPKSEMRRWLQSDPVRR